MLRILVFPLFLLFAFSSAWAQESFSFEQSVSYATSDGPEAVFTIDLNGDGHIDLVAANQWSDMVSIFINNGNGTFSQAVNYPAGDRPVAVFSADFDGDGDNDIVTANNTSDNISVLMNAGDGSFGTPTNYAAQADCGGVTACDLDGDGDIDIAAANKYSGTVSIFFNDGLGSFALVGNYQVGALNNSRPLAIKNGDINGDSSPDLVMVNNTSGDLAIIFNNGDGTFGDVQHYSLGGNPADVIIAYLNNDNMPDIAAVNGSGNKLVVLFNLGSGVFSDTITYSTGTWCRSLCAFDPDFDGDIDIAVANRDSDDLYLFENSGDGTFSLNGTLALGPTPSCIQSSFLNQDNQPDLVVTILDADSLTVFMGNRISSHISIPVANTCLPAQVPVYATVTDTTCGMQIPLQWETDSDFDLIDVSFEGTALETWDYPVVTIDNDNSTVIFGGASGLGGSLVPGDSQVIAYLSFSLADGCVPMDTLAISFDSTTIGPASLVFSDCDDPPVTFVPSVDFSPVTVLGYIAGDANSDCAVNVGDVVMLINYVFHSGSSPTPFDAGDANGDCSVNVGDAVYLINYIFKGGSAPVQGCVSDNGYKHIYGNVAFKKIGAEIDAIYNGKMTLISFDSPIDIYGVQLEIDCHSKDNIVNLIEKTQLYTGYANGQVTIGVLDINGNGFIPAGHMDVLRIPGEAHIVSALGANEEGNTFEVKINQAVKTVSDKFSIMQNYPNPFNPTTSVSYSLPAQSDVNLTIFNIAGQTVRVLVSGSQEAGEHSVIWDGKDDNGQTVSSGIYFYKITAGQYTETKQMVLLK